jgi:hypothetical protein
MWLVNVKVCFVKGYKCNFWQQKKQLILYNVIETNVARTHNSVKRNKIKPMAATTLKKHLKIKRHDSILY